MTLIPYSAAWLALACAVLGLAFYRKLLARGEDDRIHLNEADGPQVARQTALLHRLEFVERWGQTLTIITVLSGVILCGLFLYQKWLETLQPNY